MKILDSLAKLPVVKGFVEACNHKDPTTKVALIVLRTLKVALPIFIALSLYSIATGPAGIAAKILSSLLVYALYHDAKQVLNNADRSVQIFDSRLTTLRGMFTHNTIIFKPIVNAVVDISSNLSRVFA